MGRVTTLLRKLGERGEADCVVEGGRYIGCDVLLARVTRWQRQLAVRLPQPGSVLGLAADHSADAVALLLAAWSRAQVVALLPRATVPDTVLRDACIGTVVRLDADPAKGGNDLATWTESASNTAAHPLLDTLRGRGEPGVIVFTSGTSGRPKAVLHSAETLLRKFDAADRALRTLAVLQFDHIAGLDSLLYTLAANGVWVIPSRREPDSVCASLAAARVQVLNTTPSFLRLLWASGRAAGHDLTSVEIVTYGSEPMDPATLERARLLFPRAKLRQKYGTTETGAPRTQSEADGSLRIRLAPDDTGVRVRDGVLWIRSEYRALGYLNAASPFDAEGWYCTGDLVDESEDGWLRVRGRASELINVGGEKVSPVAVERVILEMDGIVHAVVRGRAHPLLGQVVTATVELRDGADADDIERRVRRHCQAHLPRAALPMTVDVAEGSLVTARLKLRRLEGPADT